MSKKVVARSGIPHLVRNRLRNLMNSSGKKEIAALPEGSGQAPDSSGVARNDTQAFLDRFYEVSQRNVKYPRLEFKTGILSLVLPIGYNPDVLLEKHRGWILKKSRFIEECLKASFGKKLAERTEGELRDVVRLFAERGSSRLGVKVNKIYLRMMRSKWASCSSRSNLTVNKLMKYLPEGLIEYAIFHEIAHIIEKRHNGEFWRIVSKEFSNHQELEKDLFVHWFRVVGVVDESGISTSRGVHRVEESGESWSRKRGSIGEDC